jgi:hypothetical protein
LRDFTDLGALYAFKAITVWIPKDFGKTIFYLSYRPPIVRK